MQNSTQSTAPNYLGKDTSENPTASQTTSFDQLKNILGISDQQWTEVLKKINIPSTQPPHVQNSTQSTAPNYLGKDTSENPTTSQTNGIDHLKNIFGISDQQWSEILKQINIDSTQPPLVQNSTQSAAPSYPGKDTSENPTTSQTVGIDQLKNILGISDQELFVTLEKQRSLQIPTIPIKTGQTVINYSGIGTSQKQTVNQPDRNEQFRNVVGISNENWSTAFEKHNSLPTAEIPINIGKTDFNYLRMSQNQIMTRPYRIDQLKNVLEISGQQQSEAVQLSNPAIIQNDTNHQDMVTKIMTNLSKLDSEQLLTVFNDNTQLFLKTAKMFNMLTRQDVNGNGKQILTELLGNVKEKLQTSTWGNSDGSKQKNVQSTFSRAESIWKNQADESQGINQVKEQTSYNNTQPFGFHPMTKMQQLSIMLGDSRKSAPMDGIIEQFDTILSKSRFAKTDGVQKLFIKLNPENLGSIRIEMVQKDQTIVAKIVTSSQTAKDILESDLNSLKNSFIAQNIHVDKLEISSSPVVQTQQDQFFKREQQNHQGQNFEEQNHNNNQTDDGTENEFTLSLEQALFNTKV